MSEYIMNQLGVSYYGKFGSWCQSLPPGFMVDYIMESWVLRDQRKMLAFSSSIFLGQAYPARSQVESWAIIWSGQ